MIVPLFFLILIFLNLIFVKFLLNRMNSYIAENGKSSMGAVVEQIQQTYDLQVNGYYSRLHMLEDFLTQEGVRSIELDRNKKFFEAWQKELLVSIQFNRSHSLLSKKILKHMQPTVVSIHLQIIGLLYLFNNCSHTAFPVFCDIAVHPVQKELYKN